MENKKPTCKTGLKKNTIKKRGKPSQNLNDYSHVRNMTGKNHIKAFQL